jgi:RNA polymerase sigma-70 factor (ECF subfamily)
MTNPGEASHRTAATGPDNQAILDLVEEARAGKRAAFAQLVELFQRDIYLMVYYRTRSRMDSEDLTQEVFLKAFKGLERLRDASRFRPWLYSIAVNRVRDFHRRRLWMGMLGLSAGPQEADDVYEEVDSDPGPLDQILRREFWDEINRASQRFSRSEREVFYLRFLDHLNVREIAETLEKSEGTVKSLLHRALLKLRDETNFLTLYQGEFE